MTIAGWVLAAALCQDAPLKLKFKVEHINLQNPKQTPLQLKPDEAKSFIGELKELAAVQDATFSEWFATVTLKPEATLRWTELKAIGKKTLSYDGGKPVIVINSLKLDGHVTVTLHVEKNADKVPEALKSLGFQDVTSSGDDYECKARSPVDLFTVVKTVALRTGVEFRVFEIFKDVVWHAPAPK